jgi:hypothetical protein
MFKNGVRYYCEICKQLKKQVKGIGLTCGCQISSYHGKRKAQVQT